MNDEYRGTTVNERLYLSGLINEFDAAIGAKDVDKAKDILKRVELTETDFGAILLQEKLFSSEDVGLS